MLKKHRKLIIFLFLLFIFLGLSNFVFSQRKLEVEYPAVSGFKPEEISTPIEEYVRYVYNFIIILAGVIALGALVWGGILYLTSAGKPEILRKARDQILFAFLGIAILLSSYLILTTINPQLLLFLPPQPPPAAPTLTWCATENQYVPDNQWSEDRCLQVSITPPAYEADPLKNIKNLATGILNLSSQIEGFAKALVDRINNCDCQNTQSTCLCRGGQGASCEPVQCFVGPGTNPCLDINTIKHIQETLIVLKDEILYYKNSLIAEKEDLLLEITYLEEKINYFTERIIAEEEYRDQLEDDAAKTLQQEVINAFQEEKNKIEEEGREKEELARQIEQLTPRINEIAPFITNIAQLPNECLANVPEKCQASCQGGCHDVEGCFPDSCSGGNPCPTDEVRSAFEEIRERLIEINNIALAMGGEAAPPFVELPFLPGEPLPAGPCDDLIIAQAATYAGAARDHCGPETLGYSPGVRVDCSGFVSRVYRDLGIVPRDWCTTTWDIYTTRGGGFLREISVYEVKKGDLVWSDSPQGRHVVIFVRWISNIGGRFEIWHSGACSGGSSMVCNKTRNPVAGQRYYTKVNECNPF